MKNYIFYIYKLVDYAITVPKIEKLLSDKKMFY